MNELNRAAIEWAGARVLLHLGFPLAVLALAASACAGAQPFPPPTLRGNAPRTERPFMNEARDFQFGIMSDRTGGMQPGVFEEAARKVNLLRPEFVMSIGDLIDGYTEDEALVQEQWEAFDAIVDQLEMPFFYLAGNHDISNEMMRRMWHERLGPEYYHFVYGDVLFLCLNTEPHCLIDDEQVAHFRRVIDEHPDARWTMVFLHRPLWTYESQCGLEKITGHLGARPFTVFSGHDHAYRKSERGGIRYFTLATTGGGGPLRGPEMGETHHLTWVTMTDDGPRIANLLLDGIYDQDMVDDVSYPMVESLRHGGWLYAKPIVHDTEFFDELTVHVHLMNRAPHPMRVRGNLPAADALRFAPSTVDAEVGPSDALVLPLRLLGGPGQAISRLDPVRIELTASYEREGKPPLAASAARDVFLDWGHVVSRASQPVRVDGRLDDWDEARFLDCRHPQYVKEDWTWDGPDDGRFRFGTARDEEHLHLAVQSFDDRLLFEPGKRSTNQDRFIVTLDARPASARGDVAEASPDGPGVVAIELEPGVSGGTLPGTEHAYRAECRADDTGFTAELAVPQAYLDEMQGGRWQDVRLNVAYMDHDNPRNIKPAVLWWRPPWDGQKNYAGSGTFARE